MLILETLEKTLVTQVIQHKYKNLPLVGNGLNPYLLIGLMKTGLLIIHIRFEFNFKRIVFIFRTGLGLAVRFIGRIECIYALTSHKLIEACLFVG